MNFDLTEDQRTVVAAAEELIGRFDDQYWLDKDRSGEFPEEFVQAVADGGWLGIAMPRSVGGAGLGITEAALFMMTVANSAGGMSAASSIHINIFGPNPIVVFGTDEQKERMLRPLVSGEDRCCFGVTEADAGLNTTAIKTFAKLQSSGDYLVSGNKIWTSCAQRANKILLLARTQPAIECSQPTEGLSLFYTDLNRDFVDVVEIDKMGRHAVDSNLTFFDELPVPKEDLIGEEGKGFKYILHGLNPERILIAAEAIGLGKSALSRATSYARERIVFGRPIGMNQAIQHPLARNWIDLQSSELLMLKAAAKYDLGQACGAEANAAKYAAGEAAFNAATQAVMTHGGMGYAKEFHVERLMRESMIPRIAPVSPQLALSFLAEKVLGLPKSY